MGDLPPYEAFPIGGTNSVRGYSEGGVGSGRNYAAGTAEFHFPLFKPIQVQLTHYEMMTIILWVTSALAALPSSTIRSSSPSRCWVLTSQSDLRFAHLPFGTADCLLPLSSPSEQGAGIAVCRNVSTLPRLWTLRKPELCLDWKAGEITGSTLPVAYAGHALLRLRHGHEQRHERDGRPGRGARQARHRLRIRRRRARGLPRGPPAPGVRLQRGRLPPLPPRHRQPLRRRAAS